MGPIEYIVNFFIGTFYSLKSQPTPSRELLAKTKLVAHRGVHENQIAKENSHEAFALAVENKIWAIEFDVHFTNDHIPVVNHDPDCGRLHDRAGLIIRDTNFQTLRSEAPNILSLEEVITQFSSRLHLMIELKVNLGDSTENKNSLQKILTKLRPEIDYHLLSLEPHYLTAVDFAPKSALLDVIWLDAKKIMQKNYDLGHGAIAGHFLFFSTEDIERLHSQGKKVGVGFLDSKNSLYREVQRGVDFIFTNHPISLNKHLKDLS